MTASSTAEGSSPDFAVNEDIRSWWSAGTAAPGQWLCCDLGKEKDIRAIQVNLADEGPGPEFPDSEFGDDRKVRRIELEPQVSEYTIEYSNDATEWTVLECVSAECSNGYYEYLGGIRARYIRVTGGKLPYGQVLRISGLRIFGNGSGAKPAQAKAAAIRNGDMDCTVSWEKVPGADGYNVRYGIAPNKLYCSWMVYDADSVNISMLMKDQDYWFCVDSFNENGITEGEILRLK